VAYKYIAKAWKRPKDSYVGNTMRKRAVRWRRQPAILRLDRPTRINRARSLGYKAKQGFVMARVRIRRSGFRKQRPVSGRSPKRMGVTKHKLGKNMKMIAEERVGKRFPNLEILNSYWVWEDGYYKWFEVLMVDPNQPTIISDKDINWICNRAHKHRVFRGLTSSGKKIRGLSRK